VRNLIRFLSRKGLLLRGDVVDKLYFLIHSVPACMLLLILYTEMA